jgi:hypothetical protein
MVATIAPADFADALVQRESLPVRPTRCVGRPKDVSVEPVQLHELGAQPLGKLLGRRLMLRVGVMGNEATDPLVPLTYA